MYVYATRPFRSGLAPSGKRSRSAQDLPASDNKTAGRCITSYGVLDFQPVSQLPKSVRGSVASGAGLGLICFGRNYWPQQWRVMMERPARVPLKKEWHDTFPFGLRSTCTKYCRTYIYMHSPCYMHGNIRVCVVRRTHISFDCFTSVSNSSHSFQFPVT
jgi:hypothetical protein